MKQHPVSSSAMVQGRVENSSLLDHQGKLQIQESTNLEIQESGNLESNKIPEMTIIRMQIRSAQK